MTCHTYDKFLPRTQIHVLGKRAQVVSLEAVCPAAETEVSEAELRQVEAAEVERIMDGHRMRRRGSTALVFE